MTNPNRTAFEASQLTKHLDLSKSKNSWGDEIYTHSHIDAMWAAWQASRKVALEEAAKLVEHICKEGGGTYGDALRLELAQITGLINGREDLERENAALKVDAARYRWLRDRVPGGTFRIIGVIYSEGGASVDAAIDSAMKEGAK